MQQGSGCGRRGAPPRAPRRGPPPGKGMAAAEEASGAAVSVEAPPVTGWTGPGAGWPLRSGRTAYRDTGAGWVTVEGHPALSLPTSASGQESGWPGCALCLLWPAAGVAPQQAAHFRGHRLMVMAGELWVGGGPASSTSNGSHLSGCCGVCPPLGILAGLGCPGDDLEGDTYGAPQPHTPSFRRSCPSQQH